MQALLWPLIVWIFREVVVKMVLFSVLFLLLQLLMPVVISLVSGLATKDTINGALANIPAGILYFAGLLRLDVGIPGVISAFVTRFFIRRLPFIG
jgi:hypothetical protein